MRKPRTIHARSTVLFGVALFAFSIGLAQGLKSNSGSEGEGLRAKESISSIGVIYAGRETEKMITLENSSDRDIIILGGGRVCTRNCCVAFTGPPQRIPSRSQKAVPLRVFPSNLAGPFQAPITFYTDCDGQPELTIQVKGRVIPSSPTLARFTFGRHAANNIDMG